jgi:hypothetical protein
MSGTGNTITIAAALLCASSLAAGLEQPLPAADAVIERVLERAQHESENERDFKEAYRFTRTKVTEHLNAQGEIRKRQEKKRENVPVPGPSASVDSERQEPAGKAAASTAGKPFEKKDFPVTEEVLRRFQFTITGREVINGRSALALDMKPASRNLPERNIKDRFINKAAGRVWIDETEHVVVKASLYLTEKVNVVGGLVGAVWAFNYNFTRERTPDGLWYARDVDWQLEGRELFSRKIIACQERITDVQSARLMSEMDRP